MSMRAYEDINRMMCKELEEIAEKGELSAGDLESVHKLTDTIKNIHKIKMYEEGGYSSDGGWRAEGMYSRDGYSNDGNSYGRGYSGRHYVRGHYSRDGGNSYGRYSRGRYSMAEGRDMVADQIRELMEDESLEPEDKRILESAYQKLNK